MQDGNATALRDAASLGGGPAVPAGMATGTNGMVPGWRLAARRI
ncbi:MAG: hypothetical protein ACLP5E_01835 [Streptosporangiaceae bacterium]